MRTYYTYQKEIFKCIKCGWSGFGEEVTQGELFQDGFEVNCPKCHHLFELIPFPTFDEVLQYGSEEEKIEVQKQISQRDKNEKAQLKSINQLPEIDKDGEIKFHLKEEKAKRKEYLVIYADDKEIWRELMYFEYYDRYIKLAQMLKQKYGSRMIDLETDDFVPWMYGDCSFSEIQKVKEFRKTLRG